MLKYIFSVLFDDGTTYEQNPQDISLIDAQRSCYFDIQRMVEEGKRVVQFVLNGQDDAGHIYAIDLVTGEFVVNQARFKFHEGTITEPMRLIFFRRHTHTFNAGIEVEHGLVYRFGWQATVDGENVQRVMEIE
jgi:hypothetical protein